MAYQTGSNKFGSNNNGKFGSNSKTSSAKPTSGAKQERERAPISHVMVTAKDEKGESKLMEGVYISENEYGLTFYVSKDVTITEGRYFINKRKEKAAV